MKAEEYIKQKSTTIYSGGINVEKVVSEKDALLALDAARNEMLDKVCSYLFREEYVSPEFVGRLHNANCVHQPF